MSQGTDDSPEVLERFQAELGLVELIVRQVVRAVGRLADYDDLLGAGREGLFDAARRFDPSRGIPFRAYANLRVRGAVIDGVRRQSRLPRRAHKQLVAMEASAAVSEGELHWACSDVNEGLAAGNAENRLTEHLAAMATAAAMVCVSDEDEDRLLESPEHAHSPEDQLAHAELLRLVERGVDDLSPLEAGVLRAYYFEDKSFAAIAEQFNFSKSWACRLHTQAMSRLTRLIRASI
jgi:RNA polymerase sigma factor for flagellar operon FliA